MQVDTEMDVPAAFDLARALTAACAAGCTAALPLPKTSEFTVQVCNGFSGDLSGTFPHGQVPRELFVWAVVGEAEASAGASATLLSGAGGEGGGTVTELAGGQACYLAPSGPGLAAQCTGAAVLLLIYNHVYQASPNA